MDKKLTVRVPGHLLENARRYAQTHNTTLKNLITAYLETIPPQTEGLEGAPIVRRLTGLLTTNGSKEDWKVHVEQKYGGK